MCCFRGLREGIRLSTNQSNIDIIARTRNIGLICVHIRNQGALIADYVFEHDIDMLCLTETWLSNHDESPVASLCVSPRSSAGRRGGEVEIMLKSSFCVAQVKSWRAGSFECLELVFRGPSNPSTLRLFVIYRPPLFGCKATPFRLYLDEFSHLLEHVSIKQTGLIISGDFNVHYGNVDDKNASDLAAILTLWQAERHFCHFNSVHGRSDNIFVWP